MGLNADSGIGDCFQRPPALGIAFGGFRYAARMTWVTDGTCETLDRIPLVGGNRRLSSLR